MNERTVEVLSILIVVLIFASMMTVSVSFVAGSSPEKIRVACVGDSLTHFSSYQYYLWMKLGTDDYSVRNFDCDSTTITLDTSTSYMKTEEFQNAMDFQPNIVVIMLGTNDAKSNLKQNNTTLTSDYIELIKAFQELPSEPEVWIVLPPPINSNQTSVIDAEYFSQTVIPCIRQAANQTGLKTINVYSALLKYPKFFQEDGIHLTVNGAEIIAQVVARALTGQTDTVFSNEFYRV
jgi:lysophospholipase L1-like esterase